MNRIESILITIILVLGFAIPAFAAPEEKPAAEPEKSEITLAFENANGRVLSVARYGNSKEYPENSVEGINNCIAMGIDIISVNVQLTKDKQLVLLTTSDLATTCAKHDNGSFVGGSVADYTLEELQENFVLKAGHGGILADPTGCKPASLSDAITAAAGKAIIMVNDGWKYAEQIDKLAGTLGATDSVIIRGATSIDGIKNFLSKEGKHVYVSALYGLESGGSAKTFVKDALAAGAMLVELQSDKSTSNVFKTVVLDLFASKGRAFVSMTEPNLCGNRDDRTRGWEELIESGVSIIETDYPSELATYLKQVEKYRSELATLVADAEAKITSNEYTKVTVKQLAKAREEALTYSTKGAVSLNQIDAARYDILEALDGLNLSDGKNDKVKLPGWLILVIVLAAIVAILALSIIGLRIYNKVKKSNKRVEKVKDKFKIIAPEGNDSLTSITGEELTVDDFEEASEEETPAEDESDDVDKIIEEYASSDDEVADAETEEIEVVADVEETEAEEPSEEAETEEETEPEKTEEE